MRVLVAILAVCSLGACSGEAPASQPLPRTGAGELPAGAAAPDAVKSAVAALPANDEHDLPPRASAVLDELDSQTGDDPDSGSETGGETGDETSGETGAELPASDESAELDPLAPELPEGPTPGSAEADAELLALLDDSELTQDEFEQGFGRSGPQIDGEEFVFGPNARKRGTPVVSLGKVEGPAAEGIATLAEADRRKFEGCLAMGLSKDEEVMGSLSLRLSFDAEGSVASVAAEQLALGGDAAVQSSLTTCLSSIPPAWELAEAAGSSVRLPLTLTIDES